ncbi:MAG: TRAP transporter substrate-binding protein DctP [Balneolaceae bacterium]|nr:TRAP transporter substrate-binding protein DctP [Balneolaceae bacterium]
MKKFKLIPLFFGCLILSLAIGSCDQIKDTRTVRLGHGLDVTHPVHKAMVFMADRVAKKSGGQLQIEVYPSQQLGTERELIELLQIGSLAMTKVSAAVLENFTPKARVFSLPYLFRSDEHRFSVLDGEIGRDLLLEPQDSWLRGVTYYDAGKRSFYTKTTPIEDPEDLEGLKIRVMESQLAINIVNELGGSPTPISWGNYTRLCSKES